MNTITKHTHTHTEREREREREMWSSLVQRGWRGRRLECTGALKSGPCNQMQFDETWRYVGLTGNRWGYPTKKQIIPPSQWETMNHTWLKPTSKQSVLDCPGRAHYLRCVWLCGSEKEPEVVHACAHTHTHTHTHTRAADNAGYLRRDNPQRYAFIMFLAAEWSRVMGCREDMDGL